VGKVLRWMRAAPARGNYYEWFSQTHHHTFANKFLHHNGFMIAVFNVCLAKYVLCIRFQNSL
jgi:hypothetical protein